MQIARNAAVDHLRKRQVGGLPEDVQLAADGHRDVLADVEESADLESLRACVGKLPELERRVFLHRLEGVDSPAIAEAVGLPSERVHRLFHEAKRKVRRCLGVET
jgi:RNA polymerase sigma factor (sigma-70 family)